MKCEIDKHIIRFAKDNGLYWKIIENSRIYERRPTFNVYTYLLSHESEEVKEKFFKFAYEFDLFLYFYSEKLKEYVNILPFLRNFILKEKLVDKISVIYRLNKYDIDSVIDVFKEKIKQTKASPIYCLSDPMVFCQWKYTKDGYDFWSGMCEKFCKELREMY